MNDLIESERKYPLTVKIRLSEGWEYEQPLEIDSDGAQAFMDWFRDKKSSDVWSWHTPTAQSIKMFHRIHITSVEIIGYIEPDGRKSRWYERIVDRWRSFLLVRRWLKREKDDKEAEVRQTRSGHDAENGRS